ncbi:RNA polymerase sigma factor [Hominifimenecus sp. rT4P-3]|uniref:RNA polymerase sigma factor n=1 Tax=Hominifimenecus sp. rT4P-3 TaxID=3242979 RepID=UPI003DA6CD38
MQDQDLLELLRRTPEPAISTLMERYGGLVYAVVRRKLPEGVFCAADVEGCVADTFSEFYLDLDRYAPEKGSIRSWLCVIARNNALDLVRRRYREANILPLDERMMAENKESLLEGDWEERELRGRTLTAVKELGEPDREILLRKFYLGESSKEIAARLGLTAVNVDTRTHRAIGKLRKKLKEWGESM